MKKFILLILAAGLATAYASDQEVDTREPVQIVEEATATALVALSERREEFAADPAALRELINRDMLPLIDTQYSARLILGRAGRDASPEQLDAFAQAMSDSLLARYADGLQRFNAEERFDVLPLKGKNTEKLTRVRTRFTLENGSQVPVDFAFRKTDLGWKAFDVTIEGISYVMTYRNQIGPLVNSQGIDQVTRDIREGNIVLED
jgi:phospholipid transport system substrate-binding protein